MTSLIRNYRKEAPSLQSTEQHESSENSMRWTEYCLILFLGSIVQRIRAGDCDTKTTCDECMEVSYNRNNASEALRILFSEPRLRLVC